MTENKAPLFRNTDPEDVFNSFDIRKIFQGIRRHSIVLGVCIGLATLAGVKVARDYMTTYQASAILLYQGDNQQNDNLLGGLAVTNLNKLTTIEMIKMPKHFEAIKANLGLALTADEIAGMVDIPSTGQRVQTNLVDVNVQADNPNLAVDIANSLVKTAVKTSQDFRRKQLTTVLLSYQSQLAVLRQTLAYQMKEIEDFKELNQYFEMDPNHSSILAKVENLRAQREQSNLRYSTLLVEYENLKRETDSLPEYIPIDREAKGSPLQVRIMSLETALATALAKYTKDNPRVIQIEAELNELSRRSRDESNSDKNEFLEKNVLRSQLELELVRLQGQVRAAQKVKEEITEDLTDAEKQLEELPARQMAFVKLLNTRNVTQAEVDNMTRAVEQTQLLIDYPNGNLDIYLLAKEGGPLAAGIYVYVLPFIGGFIGLIFGCLFSISLEFMDRKLRTIKEVEGSYSIPCITIIPELRGMSRKSIGGKTRFFIRTIAEYVEKALIKKGVKETPIISIVSSTEGEGKSLIATELARYFKRSEKKVLFIELDHRKNPYISMEDNQSSISDYFAGKVEIDKLIHKGDLDTITMLASHPDMVELVYSKKMKDLWTVIKSQYDIVIMDAPGVIDEEYTDAVASQADLTLMVINSSGVNKSLVDESLKALDFMGARPSGLILNRVNPVYLSDERTKLEIKKSGSSAKPLFSRK